MSYDLDVLAFLAICKQSPELLAFQIHFSSRSLRRLQVQFQIWLSESASPIKRFFLSHTQNCRRCRNRRPSLIVEPLRAHAEDIACNEATLLSANACRDLPAMRVKWTSTNVNQIPAGRRNSDSVPSFVPLFLRSFVRSPVHLFVSSFACMFARPSICLSF